MNGVCKLDIIGWSRGTYLLCKGRQARLKSDGARVLEWIDLNPLHPRIEAPAHQQTHTKITATYWLNIPVVGLGGPEWDIQIYKCRLAYLVTKIHMIVIRWKWLAKINTRVYPHADIGYRGAIHLHGERVIQAELAVEPVWQLSDQVSALPRTCQAECAHYATGSHHKSTTAEGRQLVDWQVCVGRESYTRPC